MVNLDSLTIGEAREIAKLFSQVSNNQSSEGLSGMVGKKCIIRTYSAGVWFGEVVEKSGNEVIVKNARRLWQWTAASGISLSSVAIHGVNNSKSKIVESVDSIWLEAIELIPCTSDAVKSIEGAKNVKAQ
jgi:hypothetical protein